MHVEERHNTFENIRKNVDHGQANSASKMIRRGMRMQEPLQVDDNATLRIPEVDRGPSDSKNLLVVVLSNDNEIYRVGCKEGIINTRFTRADIDKIGEKLLKVADVPDVHISLRAAVSRSTGGQGYQKCSCKTVCTSLRCSCFKKSFKCNSRCHPGNSCQNL